MPPSPGFPSKGLWAVAGLLALMGVVFFGVGFSILSTARASKSWPTDEGKVSDLKIVEREETETDKSGRPHTRTMYTPELTYAYEVEGRTYQGSDLTPGGGKSSYSLRSMAEGELAPYTRAPAVSVHYNPQDPARACLRTEAGFAPIAFMGFGCVALLAGGALVFRLLKKPD